MSTSEIRRRDRARKDTKRAERDERRAKAQAAEAAAAEAQAAEAQAADRETAEESSEPRRGKRVLRPKEAQRRLGIGHTNFWENFVQTGRLKLVRLGPRSVGVLEHELDALIDQLAAERDLEVA
jgi:predicted DNA-binding transcriptional regulator AlpA